MKNIKKIKNVQINDFFFEFSNLPEICDEIRVHGYRYHPVSKRHLADVDHFSTTYRILYGYTFKLLIEKSVINRSKN